nr:hypothetical protein [Paraburkholderia sp. BL8N3]
MRKLAAPYSPKTERTRAALKLLAWGEQLLEIILRHHEQELHLKAGHGYQTNEEALAYMKKRELSQALLDALREHGRTSFADQREWQLHLDSLGMDIDRLRNIATEGALLGSLKRRAVARDLAIISDDAGQLNVLIHGLCWTHAERLVHKLLPLNDQHREDIARVRSDIWSLYADLKGLQAAPYH